MLRSFRRAVVVQSQSQLRHMRGDSKGQLHVENLFSYQRHSLRDRFMYGVAHPSDAFGGFASGQIDMRQHIRSSSHMHNNLDDSSVKRADWDYIVPRLQELAQVEPEARKRQGEPNQLRCHREPAAASEKNKALLVPLSESVARQCSYELSRYVLILGETVSTASLPMITLFFETLADVYGAAALPLPSVALLRQMLRDFDEVELTPPPPPPAAALETSKTSQEQAREQQEENHSQTYAVDVANADASEAGDGACISNKQEVSLSSFSSSQSMQHDLCVVSALALIRAHYLIVEQKSSYSSSSSRYRLGKYQLRLTNSLKAAAESNPEKRDIVAELFVCFPNLSA